METTLDRYSISENPYWEESSRPLTSLIFVLPLLTAYEWGILQFGLDSMRNGAEVWLRNLLSGFGFSQYFLLPLLTCAVLLVWHHLKQDRWQLQSGILSGMLIECAALALLLLLLARLQFAWLGGVPKQAFVGSLGQSWQNVVAYCGAGIYEELLFRAMFLPAMVLLLRWIGIDKSSSWTGAIFASSLTFAAAHYHFFSGYGESFQWQTFGFRFVAGVFFCLLYRFRGFGISAGTHALYDVFVGV